jgi:phenylacetate-CoA ligase
MVHIHNHKTPDARARALTSWERVRAFAPTLERTEWLSPQKLWAYQAPLLSELLLHARKTTKFYKDSFDFDLRSPDRVESNWSKVPILTRADLLKYPLKLTSRKHQADVGSVVEGHTSGSTGSPLAFKKSSASVVASMALTERLYRWWSVNGSKSLALIATDRDNSAPAPEGLTTQGWYSTAPNGLRHFIGPDASMEIYIKWLIERRPHYLGSYPPILKELARTVLAREIEIKFALVFSFATMLDQETRTLCRAAFGADIADTYGTQETDHIAAQCRDCGEFHVSAEAALVEILRPDGSPAGPGEIGRVIVTPLYNYAMPMIRYEVGDMAEVGAARPACGRGLPTLRRVVGRYRNMFRYRDGSTAWPATAMMKLSDFISLKQFQVVQTDFDHVEIRYIPADKDPDRSIDLAALTERIRTVLGQPVAVTARRMAEIERSRDGKYEDCISLVAGETLTSAPASSSLDP